MLCNMLTPSTLATIDACKADLARRELAAASSCDLFIGVARLGKGSHVELGAVATIDEALAKVTL